MEEMLALSKETEERGEKERENKKGTQKKWTSERRQQEKWRVALGEGSFPHIENPSFIFLSCTHTHAGMTVLWVPHVLITTAPLGLCGSVCLYHQTCSASQTSRFKDRGGSRGHLKTFWFVTVSAYCLYEFLWQKSWFIYCTCHT